MTYHGGAASRFLLRYPVIGAVVGALMFLGFGWITVSSVRQVLQFPKQPLTSTIAEAVPHASDTNWVTLTDARWDCDHAFTSKNEDGSARYTYVPAADASGSPLVLIAVEGAPKCSDLSSKPITGVLHPMNKLLRGSLEDEGADFKALSFDGACTLSTYLGPSNSRLGIWIAGAFALLGGLVLLFYVSRMRR